MARTIVVGALIGFAVAGGASVALADTQSLRVFGCDGAPRAVRTVPEGSLSSVEIRVTRGISGEIASNTVFQLTPAAADAEELSTAVIGGRGAFREVMAGDWTVCPAGMGSLTDYNVTQVAIINSDEEGSTKTAWLSAGGMAISGIGFGVLSGSGDSGGAVPSSTGGDGTVPAATTGDPVPQPLLPAEGALRPADGQGVADDALSDGVAPDKPNCAAAEDCLKGEVPAPLSPIS